MKTAISIPDEVFEQAEIMAKYKRKSRSQLYSEAIKEYLARHNENETTRAFDRALADINGDDENFAVEAGLHILGNREW
jgi:metal-responsive CopG/Arc/MetJ family transcriptional regulator